MVELADNEYDKLRDAWEVAQSTIDTVREPLIVLDGDLKVTSASRSFYETFKVDPKETEKRFIYDLGDKQWDIPKLRQLLEDILPKNESFDDYEVEHDFPGIGKRVMLLNARRIPRPPAKPRVILLAIEDITERKYHEAAEHQRTDDAMDKSEERYRSLFNESRDAIMTLSPEKGFLSGNPAAIKLFACRDEKDFTSRSPASLSPEFQSDGALSTEKIQKMMSIAIEKGANYFEWMHRRADGTVFPATVLLSKLVTDGKASLQATVRDITEDKRVRTEIEQRVKELEEFYKITIGRENKMIDLETNINSLLKELGRTPKY